MAPMRCCAVVSGRMARERTSCSRKRCKNSGKRGFFFGVANDKWLLRLPDPAGGIFLDGGFSADGFFRWGCAFPGCAGA